MSPMRLTTVVPDDVGWIDAVVDRWECTRRWSLRGRTPPMPLLWSLLWDDVTAQQAIRDERGAAVALLQLVHLDLDNGVAELGLLADPDHVHRWSGPLDDFLARVFRDFPLRKLTFATVAGDLRVGELFGARAHQTGRLYRHHHFGGGLYTDVEIYEVWEP
jgi:hypothetical protein